MCDELFFVTSFTIELRQKKKTVMERETLSES